MKKTNTTWEIPLMMLKLSGFYSEIRTRRIAFMAALYIVLLLTMDAAILIQVTAGGRNILRFIENMEAISCFSHLIGKMIITAYNHSEILKILNDIKRFWSANICRIEYKNKIDALRGVIIRAEKFFIFCVLISTILIEGAVLFGKSLPFGSWNMQKYEIMHKIIMVFELTVLPPSAIFIIGFDTLFVALVVELIIQFKVLRYCFKKLRISGILNTSGNHYHIIIQPHIKHHIFLLSFADSLQRYYSGAMIIQYLSISPLACAEMYAFFEDTDPVLLARHAVICFSLLLQLGIYCFSAHHLTSEAMAVGDAIFESDWYSKYDPSLLRPVNLVIQRSQRPVTFSAGGLVDMNIRTLIVVVRTSWSACTVMRAVKSTN